jgi:hypothetical protein
MRNSTIDFQDLVLDEFGRVVLSDNLLDRIEESVGILSAGSISNANCPGTSNESCQNLMCNGSSNRACNNLTACLETQNLSTCFYEPNEVPE